VVANDAQQPIWRAANRAFDRDVTLNNAKFGELNLGFPAQYFDATMRLTRSGAMGTSTTKPPTVVAGSNHDFLHLTFCSCAGCFGVSAIRCSAK